MSTEKHYAVDRLEAGRAVLVSDTSETIVVPLPELPAGIEEGMVLSVPHGDGGLDWRAARVDEAETRRCRREAEDLLRELRARDPGGDVST